MVGRVYGGVAGFAGRAETLVPVVPSSTHEHAVGEGRSAEDREVLERAGLAV